LSDLRTFKLVPSPSPKSVQASPVSTFQ
jgi:hypothetical protein